jgi:6-phosphogluconate dehydrogenase (decarboxylating)
MKVGLIGLGKMGLNLGKNLLDKKYEEWLMMYV